MNNKETVRDSLDVLLDTYGGDLDEVHGDVAIEFLSNHWQEISKSIDPTELIERLEGMKCGVHSDSWDKSLDTVIKLLKEDIK